ncbi:MAG: glycosyltransferase [Rhodopirellula sp.]|nr:glycosyltransferase [Rhodopirellula sp.]
MKFPRIATTCAVIVPCFNEADRLKVDVFAEFVCDNDEIELVFVDDGSSDATLRSAQAVSEKAGSSVSVLRLGRNGGKAEAVRQGMMWATQRDFSAIAFWDADLATPLETIPDFLEVLSRHPKVEVVWGTRLPLMGHTIDRDAIRRQTGRLFSLSSATAVGVGIRDALCGAKMFRTGPILDAILARPFSSRWIFDVEILARLDVLLKSIGSSSASQSLYEFPLDAWYEIAGSRLRMIDFVRATVELTDLCWRYRIFPGKARAQLLSDHEQSGSTVLALSPDCQVVVDASQPAERLRDVA